jgi:mono/diheme cytochrome c family protein
MFFQDILMKTTRDYFNRAVLAVLLVWGVAAGRSPVIGQKDDVALPEGEGRALMLQACVQCHDFKSIVSQRKTAQAWRRTINEMIWRGAPLLSDEAGILADYLAQSFGPDSSPSRSSSKAGAKAANAKADENQWAKYLPQGEGRSLALQACAQCHDLKIVVARRAAAKSWRRTVNEMVALGAPLTAGESAIVARYLAASFGLEIPIPEELKKKQ